MTSRFEKELEQFKSEQNKTENSVKKEKTEKIQNSQKSESKWTLDYIITHIFPVLGILMMVGGLGYFFYDGFWGNISPIGRLAFGFFIGSALVAGGYSFSDKLKTIADSVVGGGILTLYITLIYGSRFDFSSSLASLSSPLISEPVALIISALFCMGIIFYSLQRKSKVILMLGMLGAYLTPFFIGSIGNFAYDISFVSFQLYFLSISLALFFASFKMNLLSLLSVNILGLFLGMISLSALIGNGFNENTTYSLLLSFGIVIAHLSFVALNIKSFASHTIISSFHFIAPFIWFSFLLLFVVDETVFTDIFLSFSLGGILMALLSFFYFSLWNFLERNHIHSDNLQAGLYAIGFISGGVAFFDIFSDFGLVTGLSLSALSLVFALLLYINPKSLREIAFLLTAIVGTLLVSVNAESYTDMPSFLSIFSEFSFYTSLSLIPFLLHFFLPKGKNGLQDFRKILAYVAICIITILLGLDIISALEIDISIPFLFFTIPSALCAMVAIYKSNASSGKMAQLSLVLLALGYFTSFFIFWDNLFPAHHYSQFLITSEQLTGFVSLLISGSLIYWVKKYNEKFSSGFHFISLLAFILILFQCISNEIITIYNIFTGISASDYLHERGVLPFLISLWWAFLAFALLFVGIKNSKKFPKEKMIGMILLILTFAKIFLFDLVDIDTNIKVMLFMIIGGALLGLSYFLHVKNITEEKKKKNPSS